MVTRDKGELILINSLGRIWKILMYHRGSINFIWGMFALNRFYLFRNWCLILIFNHLILFVRWILFLLDCIIPSYFLLCFFGSAYYLLCKEIIYGISHVYYSMSNSVLNTPPPYRNFLCSGLQNPSLILPPPLPPIHIYIPTLNYFLFRDKAKSRKRTK